MARPVGARSVQERAVPAPRELLAPVLCARIARARGLLMPPWVQRRPEGSSSSSSTWRAVDAERLVQAGRAAPAPRIV